MRSRYPFPGIRPWPRRGRLPWPGGARPGRVSHYMDRYYRNVSTSGDSGPAGGDGARRWLVLAAGTVAVTAGSAFQYGLAYLIPALRADGLSLAQAGVIVACPT